MTIAANNNPLGRLHNILLEIKNFKNSSPYQALSSIFNLNINEKSSILACYSDLFKLCEDARSLIINLPLNQEKLLNPVNDVVLALSKIEFNDSTGLLYFKQSLTEQLLSNLDLCSEILSYTYNEKELETSELEELSESLNSLQDLINNTSINNELKNILILHLKDIDISISKYKLYGVSGIKTSLTTTLGDIIINNNLAVTKDEKSVIENTLKFMSKINTVISFSKNLPLIIPSIIALIS